MCRDSSVGTATRYRAGRFGDRISVGRGGGNFRTRQDRPWSSPRILYNGNRIISGSKVAGGVALTNETYLAPRLKKE